MNPIDIVITMCRYARDHAMPMGAVRVQKLVYLLECEFYAWEQERLTGLEWLFYHYGPWSRDLAVALDKEFNIQPEVLADGRQFHQIRYEEREFERKQVDMSPGLRGMFLRIMDAWAGAPLPELLDHVYFGTTPMGSARRGEHLDFSGIEPAKERRFPIDPVACLSPDKKRTLRTLLAAWASKPFDLSRPTHDLDESGLEVLRELDAEEFTGPLAFDVGIDGPTVESLRGGIRE